VLFDQHLLVRPITVECCYAEQSPVFCPYCLLLQVVCGSESLLVLTSDRPLQHNSTNNSGNTHAGPNFKQQQSLLYLVDQAASLANNSSTTVAGEGSMSMDGVDWEDVEGQGPFYCPAPRTGSGRRVSV
jgi:hypothetical protein